MGDQLVAPFRINVPQRDLDDLRLRLERTRWAEEISGAGADYGVPASYVRRLFNRWLSAYDWRAWETRLNQYAQFETTIDGQHIHFLHVRSARKDAFPLIMSGAGTTRGSPALGRSSWRDPAISNTAPSATTPAR